MMYDISKLKELRIKYPQLTKYYKITELLLNINLTDNEEYRNPCLYELEEILKGEVK